MPTLLECVICKEKLAGRTAFFTHLASQHYDYRRHTCANCDFFSVSSTLMTEHYMEKQHCVTLGAVAEDVEKEEAIKMTFKLAMKKAESSKPAQTVVQVAEADGEQELGGGDETADAATGDQEMVDLGSENGGGAEENAAAEVLMCRHHGCGFKMDVTGIKRSLLYNIKRRHIEKTHLKNKTICPVVGCTRVNECFAHFDSVTRHITNVHGGMKELSKAEHDQYDASKDEAKAVWKSKFLICFPSD